jgi:hypothetical protein
MATAMTKMLWWAITIVSALLPVAQLAAVGFGRPLHLYDPISGLLVVLGIATFGACVAGSLSPRHQHSCHLRTPEQLFRHSFRENVDERVHGVWPPTLFGYSGRAHFDARLAGYTRILAGSAGAAAIEACISNVLSEA